ncbi:MAG: amidohydrolase family protein, partial [bacterium]
YQIRGLAQLAVKRGLFLQIHSGAAPVSALFSLAPKIRILWAHAGMSEPPEVIGRLLEAHKNLWVGLSFRAGDIVPGGRGGRIDPEWRALFLRHPDRFVYGTDTYITERWGGYGELVEAHRVWLRQLPRKVAEKIAYRNAVRLFGAGKGTGLPE